MRLTNFLATLGLALILTLGLSAQTVRVIFVSGNAALQRPDEAALRPAVKGETVIIGTRIVTGPDGRLVLTPMPGVKSIVTPNTTLTLESVSETRTSPTEVTHKAILDLKEGAVVSDLQKPEGVAYDYSIRTARGLAGARGTTFTVGINPAGIQTVVVAHGSIYLNFTDGRQVVLALGQLSITRPGGATQSVANVAELPVADKAIAQKWVETTVGAIAAAIEAGVEVDGEALRNALAAAENLGITLPPELQALVERVLAQLEAPRAGREETTTQDVKDVVTENQNLAGGFPSIDAYIKSLTTEQAAAFESLRNGPQGNVNSIAPKVLVVTEPNPGYDEALLTQLLKDAKLAAGLTDILNLYIELKAELFPQTDDAYANNQITSFLYQLGILGNNNFTAIGSDTVGLKTLLLAYDYFDGSRLSETDYPKGNNSVVYGYNFFFPGEGYNNGGKGVTIYDVTFDTDGGSRLLIGATRNLLLDNVTLNAGYSYGEPAYSYGQVELRAADLVSLNNTRFGPNVTDVLIAAATVNLSNVTFNEGSYVNLYSKLGQANFGSSKFGHVNFIQNVNYGTTAVNATTLPTLDKIHIDTLDKSINNRD